MIMLRGGVEQLVRSVTSRFVCIAIYTSKPIPMA